MASLTSQLVIELLDRVSAPARRASEAMSGLSRRIREASNTRVSVTDRLDAALARNARALEAARLGVADAIGSYYSLQSAIAGPVQAAADFESVMADVAKVVDFPTPEAFAQFQSDLLAMSRDIPFAVEGLGEIAAAAGQAGIARKDLLRFTEAAAKIGVAFDVSSQYAGGAMANLMTALGLSIDETVLLADAMNHLSNNQASSAAEILHVVKNVGAQAKMFGFSAEQTSAFASAMIAAGAQSDVAATSFMNMGKALTRGAAATGSQREAFAQLGLDAEDVAKKMQEDAVGTTVDVLRRISQLPKEQQAAISSQLFGDEARALGPLMTNLDLLMKSLGLVADEAEYAGSSMNEFAAQSGTFNANLQKFQSVIKELQIRLGAALIPALTRLGEAITPLITKISELAEAYPEVTTAVVGAAAAFIAFKGALAGLRFVGLLGSGGALSMIAGGLRSITLAARALPLLAFGAALSFLRQNWDGVTAGVQSFREAFAAGMGEAGPAVEAVSSAVSDLYSWFERLTGPIDPALWQEWGAVAGKAAADVVSAVSNAVAGAVDFGRLLVIDPAAAFDQALDGLKSGWQSVRDWLAGLDLDFGSVASSAGASLGSLGADVANAAIAAIGSGWASLVAYVDELNIDWGNVGSAIAGGVVAIASGLGEAAIAAITGAWSAVSSFASGLDIDWSQAAANILLGAASIAYGLGDALVQAMAGAYSSVHDWASTVTVDWGAVGETIGSGVRELVGTVSGFLYETFTEIWAGVADWLKSDGPGVDWAGVAGSIVDAVFDGIGAAWNAYSDFVMGLLRGLFGDIPNEIFEAGENLIQRLQDGAAQKFDDFLSWVGGIPGRIVDAIGSIDLSSIIDFGEPPRWLKWLMGDEETARPAAPPPPSQAELGTLDANQRAAAETLMAARAAGDLPTPEYLNDLSDYAGQLRAEMANVQAQIDQIDENGPMGDTIAAPLQRDLRQLQEELVSVEKELQTGRERADAVTEALRILGEAEVEPEITTASIGRALERVRALRSEIRAVERGADAPLPATPPLDGARAKGGPVSRGGSYLVGEDGPEVITPSRAGFVHTHAALSNMVKTLRAVATLSPVLQAPGPELISPPQEVTAPEVEPIDLPVPEVRQSEPQTVPAPDAKSLKQSSGSAPVMENGDAVEVPAPLVHAPDVIDVPAPEVSAPAVIDVPTPEMRDPEAVQVNAPELNQLDALDLAAPEVNPPDALNVPEQQLNAPPAVDVPTPRMVDPDPVQLETPQVTAPADGNSPETRAPAAPPETSGTTTDQATTIEVHIGQITVSPTLATTERVDPAELSQVITAAMRDQVRETFRGVFADTSMRFA